MPSEPVRDTGNKPSHYVGIGASAGGLEAIEMFFAHMPPVSGLAFIVVQHLSPDYKSLMVELLSKRTQMQVNRAEDGMQVLPDTIYLIPPKKNLTIFHGKLLLKDQDNNRGINFPIDIFLRSLAEDQNERAIAVILSGTGSDGARGVRAVKEFGGMVMVQDEQSARFDGMPRAAVSTGVADFVLAPDNMPDQLMAYVKHPCVSRRKPAETILSDEDRLTRIFSELRQKTKVDFTHYKPSTIIRRIERRMTVNQIKNLDDYVRYLQSYPGEVMTLFRELLIGVTSFFRDAEAMRVLAEDYLPDLLNCCGNREIRFWVAGCSTGEEAYTLAILARESLEKMKIGIDVKIFATDIDQDAILSAGNGVYPESITADLTPRLLSKYFYLKGENYQVARNIREMVVFARHNLIKDPPFTNIDLVSCRNLLIYLQPVLQKKVLEMFNFSLNPSGVLFLGTSETVGEMGEYFETVNSKFKIYKSRGKSQPLAYPPQVSLHPYRGHRGPPVSAYRSGNRRYPAENDERLMNRYLDVLSQYYVPLSVIVNEQMEIIHTVGDTQGYLKIPSGRAVYDITKMAARDLAIPLATGIQKAFRTRQEMTYTNIRLQHTDETRSIRMRIIPLPEKKGQTPLVAVFIEEAHREPAPEKESENITYDIGEDARQHIKDLEQELQFTKENLQATIEELETANEELQATNEELLASNEELQSTNEELHSTNEELHTVNFEYQNKIIELTELNNDVDNLLTYSKIGTLLLDEDLSIRKFSPEVLRIFQLIDKDIGRPIMHISHHLNDFDPIKAALDVQRNNCAMETEVQANDGQWYLTRILPYAIGPETYSGVVITFVNITELKNTQAHLDKSLRTSQDIIRYMPAGLFIYNLNENGELILESANPEATRLTGIDTEAWEGSRFNDIWPQAEAAGLIDSFMNVLQTGESFYTEKFRYNDHRLKGFYRITAFKLPYDRLAVSFEDISEQERVEKELEKSEKSYRLLFETMAQGVVYQNDQGKIISSNPSAEKILGLNFDQMQGRTSMDPRWKTIREDGTDLPGSEHPSMVSLSTGKPVHGFVMGIYNPQKDQTRWIMVNATPLFHEGHKTPHQVYSTFEDITPRKLAEMEKEKLIEQLRSALDENKTLRNMIPPDGHCSIK